ncbi:RimJ/RimL family protein N-acetyltransferase [Alkaliphilus hydrothermalis]|uniref:RimJ/RimL family protein N-acetyltransferase n=2 Tax=Alkaliphilus hydrothermalis TaxID=1482730 RepID=A0ABS2NRG4_9FIRM|nr:RimJ/RimL family protein N-acetyltransferase [Alkaliphilus hydrothermalis]
MLVRGKKTYITKLKRPHIDKMQLWGTHRNPLFYCYTFPKMNREERNYWFGRKKDSLTRKSFAIFNEDDVLIGYISLRDINWLRRSSELGIVFDPKYMNKGYGTDALKSFIYYYFKTLKMKQLKLRVAEFNIRAQRCYENCGFATKESVYENFEDQSLPVFENDNLKEYQRFFKKSDDMLQCNYIHMYITKGMFIDNLKCYPHYPPNTCA